MDGRSTGRIEKQRGKLGAKLAERDERITESRRRAADDRRDMEMVVAELVALYAEPDELLKHARVVGLEELRENEFNLNIPRYVDTFEPEPQLEVKDALASLREVEAVARDAEKELARLITVFGCS
jgi:type I restriction enzyme M protein